MVYETTSLVKTGFFTIIRVKQILLYVCIQIVNVENRVLRTRITRFSASCPEGYAVFRGICYKFFDTRKTFSDAAAACGEDGGTLAMPRDAETNAFLISLYRSVSDSGFWFGLHDRREEGSFEWVDGSALGTYSSWAPGQPDNLRGGEDCVLYSFYWNDKWADSSCDRPFRFICQAVPGTSYNRTFS